MMMKNFNDMLEIDILRNSSQKNLGVLMGAFLRVWVTKKAKTMNTWVRYMISLVDSAMSEVLNKRKSNLHFIFIDFLLT